MAAAQEVINSTFVGNSAYGLGNGGAINSRAGTTLRITGTLFGGNSAMGTGGAVYYNSDSDTVIMSGSSFDGALLMLMLMLPGAGC